MQTSKPDLLKRFSPVNTNIYDIYFLTLRNLPKSIIEIKGDLMTNLLTFDPKIQRILEKPINDIGKVNPNIIANFIGMAIPPDLDPIAYLADNLFEYISVLTRDNNNLLLPQDAFKAQFSDHDRYQALNQYTDTELLLSAEAFIPYISRNDLITKILSGFKRKSQFFVPINPYCSNERVIAYGRFNKYICLTVHDLAIDSLITSSPGKYTLFHQSNEIKLYWDDLYNLNRLLNLFRSYLLHHPDYLFVLDKLYKLITTNPPKYVATF